MLSIFLLLCWFVKFEDILYDKQSYYYLGDGEVEADVDDDEEEEKVEGTDHEEGLLQQTPLLEAVVQLKHAQTSCQYFILSAVICDRF